MKTVNIEKLNAYKEANKDALTTTEIIKDSFKNAFKKLDLNDFVIVKNNRREEDSVMVSLSSYLELLNKIDKYEEDKYDKWAENHDVENLEFVDASKIDL